MVFCDSGFGVIRRSTRPGWERKINTWKSIYYIKNNRPVKKLKIVKNKCCKKPWIPCNPTLYKRFNDLNGLVCCDFSLSQKSTPRVNVRPHSYLVIPTFSLLSFPLFFSCHSRESGNPGEMKYLCPLDLRVRTEDDKPIPILSFPWKWESMGHWNPYNILTSLP